MEDRIEVGEYVRTKDGLIGTFDRYSKRTDKSLYKSPFNCFIKLQRRKTPLQCHENYIVKHSKQLIDLIEVGDIVNREEVIEVRKQDGKIYLMTGYVSQSYIKDDIKTILTKELYEANCYKTIKE